jgi:hypothetical protein
MRAFLVAAPYFGSFIAIGLIVKLAVNRLGRDTDLADIQSQAGPNRRSTKACYWARGVTKSSLC